MAPRRKQDEPLQLRMRFRSPVTTVQLGTLVTEVIKHVLYDRERLPMPFDQFKMFLRDTWSKHSLSEDVKAAQRFSLHKQRRAAASFSNMDRTLSTISSMVQQNQVHEIRVLIGSTFVTPREQYSIRVPHHTTCNDCGSERGLRQCLLDMLNTIINSSADHARLPPSAKVSTFLRTNRRHVVDDEMEIQPNFRIPRRGKVVEFDFLLKNCPHSAESGSRCSSDEFLSQNESSLEYGHGATSADGADAVVWVQFKNVFSTIDIRTFRQGCAVL
ncbi:MAD2L1-binding protein-like [Ornithodoros turicata]|uniref:MAD2L1-binding protein-like n=1 Tax=Ornithodoros turicata TaxID=34597 RepID=UPI00313900E1